MTGEMPIGTEEGVLVDGVGQLYWTLDHTVWRGDFPPKARGGDFETWSENVDDNLQDGTLAFERIYALPNDHGFGLTLWLDEPFRTVGFESFSYTNNGLEDWVNHLAFDENSIPEDPKFAPWFITSLTDIVAWTGAENVMCFDDGPERDRPYNVLDIAVGFGPFYEFDAPKIGNNDVFIGSVAAHMSELAQAPEN